MMQFLLKSGVLWDSTVSIPLASVKSTLAGPQKQIVLPTGTLVFTVNIQHLPGPPDQCNHVQFREYVLLDRFGNTVASARPKYAPQEHPDLFGWPACRIPKIDRAVVNLQDQPYLLTMCDPQTYRLTDNANKLALQFLHQSLFGGWRITADAAFPPEVICGLFCFCRYVEKENELFVV